MLLPDPILALLQRSSKSPVGKRATRRVPHVRRQGGHVLRPEAPCFAIGAQLDEVHELVHEGGVSEGGAVGEFAVEMDAFLLEVQELVEFLVEGGVGRAWR